MNSTCRDLLYPEGEDLLLWPAPDLQAMPEKYRPIYMARADALRAVVSGTSIHQAASHFGVNRTTLSSICRRSVELHADGRPWGFRACVPNTKKGFALAPSAEFPAAHAPHAFEKVLASFPEVKDLVDRYSGPLPRRGSPSAKFNRLYKRLKKELEDAGLSHLYPLNTQTQGRRALITYVYKRRQVVIAAGGGDGTEAPSALTRLDQVVSLMPLERVEFDAHHIDVKTTMLVHTAKGEVVSRPVGTIWILVAIDVCTRVILAWLLVYGPSYKRFPVLRLLAKPLTPWRPRQPTVADMHYSSKAWMPSLVDAHGLVHRALMIAMDNAKAHHAHLSMGNIHDFQLGMANAGRAHSPQGRAFIEALFKTLESQVLRYLAGGFEPARERGESARPVSTKKAEQHPIDPVAMDDLMDVFVANYHGVDHSGLQNRTPREAFESYFAAGGWFFTSTNTATDVDKLTEIHFYATIRGYRRDGKPPHVRWKGATYRASALMSHWDLVGRRFPAAVRFSDARQMRLFHPETGELFVVLEALPPWHATPHTLEVRERALIYLKQAGQLREDIEDAVAAYHEHTRQQVIEQKLPANHFIQAGAPIAPSKATPRKPVAQDPSTYTPSTGWVSFRSKRGA
jgi:hypothetical protein